MLSNSNRLSADPRGLQKNNMDTWNATQRPSRSSTLPPLFSSKPMVIPSKGHRRNENSRHAGVPPAVAALLAVTAIPRQASKKSRVARRRTEEEVIYGPKTPPSAECDFDVGIEGDDEKGSPEELYHQGAHRAALEMLLSTPEDDDECESSEMSRSDSGGLLSVRSTSTESVPSLETDNESTFSYSSSYSNASRRRANADPRARIIASPPEECDTDHPLLFGTEGTKTPEGPGPIFSEDTLKRVTRRLNLKSNLTASLRVLKSAARSFSSLTATAAAMQPDDYLTRSILSISPQYTDEKRPALSKEVPTPAVRRYLNPWAATYDESPCTGAVQMQTYHSSTGGRKSARSARKTEVEVQPRVPEPTERQRENRENSNFLRVIVLEMNMRREGKLSETAQGRARLVLPPRQPCKVRAVGDPGRWKAWACVYDEQK